MKVKLSMNNNSVTFIADNVEQSFDVSVPEDTLSFIVNELDYNTIRNKLQPFFNNTIRVFVTDDYETETEVISQKMLKKYIIKFLNHNQHELKLFF